ncbi:MAG TPA: hypothetical protein VFU15_03220 [Bacteroidia bacterium]|nr:hypothetical protein [Bacteroidia bacterium]
MVRPLIIVVNLLIAFFLKFMTGTPSADITFPSTAKPGDKVNVKAVIHTNGETGFIRFAMEVPEGWTVDTAKCSLDGSSFFFEKNTAKFIWSKPASSDLTVSFKVVVPSSANGDYSFPCKISHTVNNLPDNIQLTPLKLNVSGSGSEEDLVKQAQDSTSKPDVAVSAVRTVPPGDVTGEFSVDVLINKDDLGGWGKLEDSLPSGFLAQPDKNDGGEFHFENGVVRIYWYKMPSKTTLNVRYKVIASPDADGQKTIYGHFAYLENFGAKVIGITPSVVNMKSSPALVVNDQNTNSGNKGNSSGTSQDSGNNGNTGTTGDQGQNSNTDNSGNNAKTNNSGSENNAQAQNGNAQNNAQNSGQQNGNNSGSQGSKGVTYSVQIAAMKRMVPVSYYQSTYGIAAVNAEQIDGLNKYTTGSFTSYNDARDHRETIRNKGVTGPFVAAYNSGKRITVQEALMITGQKWVP